MRRHIAAVVIETVVAAVPAVFLTVTMYLMGTGIAESSGDALLFALVLTPSMYLHALPIAVPVALVAAPLMRGNPRLSVPLVFALSLTGGALFGALAGHGSPHISLPVATLCGAASWSLTVGGVLAAATFGAASRKSRLDLR